MPYKRPMTPPGYFRKHEFVYDEYYDCYICPEDQILSYRATNREGYREYLSDSSICKSCPALQQCTKSKYHQKLVLGHIWQDALDEAEHLRHTDLNKEIYEKRKETIERVFADLKQKHVLRWTNLKGAKKFNAGDACFRCHELEKISQLALEEHPPSNATN